MLNIEKYKDDILNAKQADIHCSVHNILLQLSHIPCTGNCRECKKNVMEWLLEEYKEPILDDAEKKYLSEVTKPFLSKIKYIAKFKSACSNDKQYIHIAFYEEEGITFPYFKANSMYKGMELNKAYTLKELRLC